MNSLEILNTKVPVIWSSTAHQSNGKFELSGKKYTIQLGKYEIFGKTLIDFVFLTNGSITAQELKINSAKIIGAVLNGAIDKIKELNPDIILIAVQKNSGLIESRKSLYEAITRWMGHRLGFTFAIDWIENKDGFYKLIARESIPSDELQAVIDEVKSK